jgi:hypothetical protein
MPNIRRKITIPITEDMAKEAIQNIILARTLKKSWSKKLYTKVVKQAGKKITFFGC